MGINKYDIKTKTKEKKKKLISQAFRVNNLVCVAPFCMYLAIIIHYSIVTTRNLALEKGFFDLRARYFSSQIQLLEDAIQEKRATFTVQPSTSSGVRYPTPGPLLMTDWNV